MPDFPIPAYQLIERGRDMLGSVQFSSGCPYRCEFCDIPALYGRQPRLKKPKQILAELDAMLERGPLGAVYFVDDNFIANRKAARDLLPHLIAWQKERGYPIRFACEATLNIAKLPDLLEQMREAYFTTVFCGIETPELRRSAHGQGAQPRRPAAGGVETLNQLRHGGGLRHHHRARHRHAGHRPPHQGLHRGVAYPAADNQPAAGPAAHAAVGPPQARRTAAAGGGRGAARLECGFPHAL